MSDERGTSDDSTRFAAGRGGDETRFTGVGAPPPGGSPSHTTFPPGSLIGHTYRIEALLARGGMGEVYRARHAELNTDHALKIILPELANNQRIVDLFRREASVLRTIRHDAVVAYDGVSRDENGRLYLVMEFVDGPSLSKLMGNRTFTAEEVRQLRDRLADGLAVAHDKGVIHRDISPDNVILPGGDVDKAKIIDFGISKMADPEQKTIVGDDFAGKFSYVSPEQLGMFGGKVDGRSDIYSLGLVLAAAAQGEPLDMGQSPISVIEARRTVPDLSRVPAAVRADLAAMLQPDPAKRPQSMHEMARPLEQRGGRSTLSDSARRSSVTKAGAGRMGVTLGALAILIVAGGTFGYWWWQNRDTRDGTTGTAQQTGGSTTSNAGATEAASTAGQATQQSTTSTVANQTQNSAAGTSAQDTGTGATAAQQQQQATTGATSSSAGATTADGGQATGPNSTTATANGNESAAATESGAATSDNVQSQLQQTSGAASVATTETVQTTAEGPGSTASDEQQSSNVSQSNETPAAGEQHTSSAEAGTGDQTATTIPATETTTSSTTTTQDAVAATSNDAASSAGATATESGTSDAETAATGTQTALLPHVPDVAKLRSDAEQAVQGLSCAGVRVAVSDAGDIRASGYVASKTDSDKAAARLTGLPDVGRVDNAVAVMAPPLCDVLDVLRAHTAFDQGRPALGTAAYREGDRIQVTATTIYRAGDHIQVTVTAPPGFEGYLYVDYIDAAERYVLHLLPNSDFRPENSASGGKQIVIGSLPREYDTYKIQPPFGANLIVAIASRKPLFPVMRPIQESVDQYLPALRGSLAQVAAQGGADLASQYAGVLLRAH